MDEELRNLEEYCPPIDPALIHALYPDYAPHDVAVLRSILDSMKNDAFAEQLTEFDASGSGGGVGGDAIAPAISSLTLSGGSDESSESQSTVTDSTGTGLRRKYGSTSGSSSTESLEEGSWFSETEQLDTPTKELLLAETFPSLRLDLVTYTLKKCNNDFGKAMDELLNHVYFEDERTSPAGEATPKGIDAFSEDHHIPRRGKKGKKNKKKKIGLYDVRPNSEPDSYPPPPTNRWDDGGKDIEFIASRTKLEPKVVASLYHKNGASLAATILTLIRNDMIAHAKDVELDAGLVEPAIELVSEFTNMDLGYAVALIRLTQPSTANAHELAKALTVYPSNKSLSTVDLKIVPRYAPLNLSDPTYESSSKLPSLPKSPTPHTVSSLSATRSTAFTSASAAYRKGRSDPLMRGAATYYSQLGRDAHAHLIAARASEADALVSSQSTATMLDLHYVDVKSATRIAKERTRAWWDALGEERIPGGGRRGVGDGYRIVTGVGRHSEGGRGKLGPAVWKALSNEGWKVVVGEGGGELIVWGRRS